MWRRGNDGFTYTYLLREPVLRGPRDRLPNRRRNRQLVRFNASRGFGGGPVAGDSRARVLDSFTDGGGLCVDRAQAAAQASVICALSQYQKRCYKRDGTGERDVVFLDKTQRWSEATPEGLKPHELNYGGYQITGLMSYLNEHHPYHQRFGWYTWDLVRVVRPLPDCTTPPTAPRLRLC